MRKSKYYQNALQFVGLGGEVLLFLSGVFLGKGQIATAVVFLILRMANKYTVSELMYRRHQALLLESKLFHKETHLGSPIS